MINKHIEIVRSSIPSLSSMSQESHAAIFGVLAKHYQQVGTTIVNNLDDLKTLASKKPDLIFLGMKFVPGKRGSKIWVADYLDKQGITYTGSSRVAHELELNKPLAKQRALDAGLKTSPFYVAIQNELQIRAEMPLTFPLFIKPTNRGGGLGVDSNSLAHNFNDLESKIQSITDAHQSDSLIEEYLSGREFSVAILKDEATAQFSAMPIELVAPDNQGIRILSEDVKESNTEQATEVTDKVASLKVKTLALNIFHALGARDYGRIDIRMDEFGTPHFLEANLLPSLISGYGSFPKACVLNLKLDYEPMILSIVKLAFARKLNIIKNVPDLNESTDILLPSLEPVL